MTSKVVQSSWIHVARSLQTSLGISLAPSLWWDFSGWIPASQTLGAPMHRGSDRLQKQSRSGARPGMGGKDGKAQAGIMTRSFRVQIGVIEYLLCGPISGDEPLVKNS